MLSALATKSSSTPACSVRIGEGTSFNGSARGFSARIHGPVQECGIRRVLVESTYSEETIRKNIAGGHVFQQEHVLL